MTKNLHVLIVEDSETDMELLLREIRQGYLNLTHQRVETEKDYKNALKQGSWDLIISDYVMPHFSGLTALKELKDSGLDIPFIMISGKVGEETAVDSMKAGAADYVMKDKLFKLIPAIDHELRDAEERRRSREIEKELENFTAGLTHDLRTPLLAEERILEQIKKGAFGELPRQLCDVMDELQRSNRFVQHMVENILYAYKYQNKKVHLDFMVTEVPAFLSSALYSDAVQSILIEKGHQLLVEPIDSIPNVYIDQHEIQRVLVNLIKNASDHSGDGEKITLSMTQRGHYVRIAVKDNGSGISPSIEPFLFMPYATASSSKLHQVGLGLGLYLSKHVIEAHHGRIGFTSIPEEGSVFYFDLPISDRVSDNKRKASRRFKHGAQVTPSLPDRNAGDRTRTINPSSGFRV